MSQAPHAFEPRVTRGALTDICAICGVNIRRHGLDPVSDAQSPE